MGFFSLEVVIEKNDKRAYASSIYMTISVILAIFLRRKVFVLVEFLLKLRGSALKFYEVIRSSASSTFTL